jgi:hypothetical protein
MRPADTDGQRGVTALLGTQRKEPVMPRWLILLIAVLVILVIAILLVEHVHVGVH